MSGQPDLDVAVARAGYETERRQPSDLADVLERVLDTGIVIAGEIRVDLLDIELLTIKLRLVVTSIDKAEEIGLDWWRSDPWFSSRAIDHPRRAVPAPGRSGREDDRGGELTDDTVGAAVPVVDVARDERFDVLPDGPEERS